MVRVVEPEGGLVNKFDGDGALCIFGAPTTLPDHATRALRAARALRGEVRRLGSCHAGLDAGIGVASGTVVAGRVGAGERYEYTVLGRPGERGGPAHRPRQGASRRGCWPPRRRSQAAATHEAERWIAAGRSSCAASPSRWPIQEPAHA